MFISILFRTFDIVKQLKITVMKVFYLYNNVDSKIIGFYNHNGFIHKVNDFIKENHDLPSLQIEKCVDYVNNYCPNIDLHIVPIDRNDIETVIEQLNFVTKNELHYLDDLINYVVSNYNESIKDSDETWNIIIEDLIYRYTSEHPDQYIQRTTKSTGKNSDNDFTFDGFSDDELIQELNKRGYYTKLLYNDSDILNVLNEDYDGQKLSPEDRKSIFSSLDPDNFTQDINETISRMIEDDYKDKLYE